METGVAFRNRLENVPHSRIELCIGGSGGTGRSVGQQLDEPERVYYDGPRGLKSVTPSSTIEIEP